MRQVNIHEAKTHLSELLEAVELGEEVVIARRGTPVARIVGLEDSDGERKPRFGLWKDRITIDPSFYDEMTEDELGEWHKPLGFETDGNQQTA